MAVVQGGWWQLHSIIEYARQEREFYATRPPMACPRCGEPMRPAPPSDTGSEVETYCLFDGFQYPRDWRPPFPVLSGRIGIKPSGRGGLMPKGVYDSPLRGRYERTSEHRRSQAENARTHGMSRMPVYQSWSAMIQRCTSPNHKDYRFYGGRGIAVCARWRNSFENFYADMGDRAPGMTLERIRVDGDYEPGNCRWATAVEQAQNRRTRTQAPSDLTERVIAELRADPGRSNAEIGRIAGCTRAWVRRLRLQMP